jgi:HD-GYP domain-containing protein (c-di-GMP phosphodiesterase class II)
MAKRIIEVPVDRLRLGLYVSRLDRPWSGTPFLFQGFHIESEEELGHLRNLCHTVFVDATADEEKELQAAAASSRSRPMREKEPPLAEMVRHLEQAVVKDPVSLRTELTRAKIVYSEAQKTVTRIFERLRRGADIDVEQLSAVVDSMVDSVFRNRDAMSWLARMKTKDDYLYSHSLACSVWALSLGRHLGLDRELLQVLGTGAMLLDVGKTQIPSELLNKPAQPSADEWRVLRGHVPAAIRLLRASPQLDERVIPMIETHHERIDGSGYPHGLSQDRIPLLGRMAAIVDAYDAMTSERTYARARSTYDAVRELKRLSGTGFQQELVELFVQAVGVFPTGTLVELNTGEVGVVTAQNRFRRLRPEIMVLLDAKKKVRNEFRVVDLNTCDENTNAGQTGLWITAGLQPGAYGIDPNEYFL